MLASECGNPPLMLRIAPRREADAVARLQAINVRIVRCRSGIRRVLRSKLSDTAFQTAMDGVRILGAPRAFAARESMASHGESSRRVDRGAVAHEAKASRCDASTLSALFRRLTDPELSRAPHSGSRKRAAAQRARRLQRMVIRHRNHGVATTTGGRCSRSRPEPATDLVHRSPKPSAR